MRYVILIRKVAHKDDIHYYSVFKDNNYEEINYYIGIQAKKILFFENESFETPFCVYDSHTDQFEKKDSELILLINGRVIMKALKAISLNEFPESISWEG